MQMKKSASDFFFKSAQPDFGFGVLIYHEDEIRATSERALRCELVQMKMKVPLLLMPPRIATALSRPFYWIARHMAKSYSFLEKDLFKLESDINATSYLSLSLLNASCYAALIGILGYTILFKAKVDKAAPLAFAAALLGGFGVFFFCLAYPRWLSHKRVAQIDRDLLFAARHLRIQTTAGVPLFDSIVSASHGYGSVSDEFERIITNVQAGASLSDALEESSAKNPSYYYNRILWQMSNAVKAGTDIGPVLAEIVEFLAEEQRIQMRNYGAQLNSLAIMYLMACIIVPTIGLIFIMVISSFVDFPITDVILYFMLAGMVFVQYMFIGLIESRRPAVSI